MVPINFLFLSQDLALLSKHQMAALSIEYFHLEDQMPGLDIKYQQEYMFFRMLILDLKRGQQLFAR
jgi:hypothetical protein